MSLDLLWAQNGPFWGAETKGGTIAHQLTLSRTIMTYESAFPPTHGLKHLLLGRNYTSAVHKYPSISLAAG